MDISPIVSSLERGCRSLSEIKLTAIQASAVSSLQKSLLKKYVEGDEPTQAQCEAALKKFFDCQRHLSKLDVGSVTRTYLFDRVKKRLASFLVLPDVCGNTYSLSYNFVPDRDFGKGATVGCSTYDLYGKLYACDITYSDPWLLRLYRSSLRGTSVNAEVVRALQYDTKPSDSRLTFVKKTTAVARVICSEPTCNMMAQKAIASYLTQCLLHNCGIDITKQEQRNQRLARKGSIDGMLSTIDLESASDTISLELCKALLPRGLLAACLRARCGTTLLADGRSVRLKMISSMGNAFTFPLQTLIFSAICHTVRELRVGRFVDPVGKLAVYGDDMIVDTKDFESTLNVLRIFGFIPNMEKSYTEPSRFRESCGGDFESGVNIRGIYIKSLASQHSLYHAFNSLRYWGLRHNVCVFRLLLPLRRAMRRPVYVPIGSPSTDGIQCELRQAERYGCVQRSIYMDDGIESFDPYRVVYKRHVAVRRTWVKKALLDANPDGLLLALSSCRISSEDFVPQLSAKPAVVKRAKLIRWKNRFATCSSWPNYSDWWEQDDWRMRQSRVLAAHGLAS